MNTLLFSTYILPAVLFIIMFGMGMSLEIKDFKTVFNQPRALTVGLIAQMLILPVVAFILSFFLNIDPLFKVGLVLIAACPGGTASNLVAFMLRGNLALCIALTAITSILILFSLPILVHLSLVVFAGENESIRLPFNKTVLNMVVFTLLPTVLGMLVNRVWSEKIKKIEKQLGYFMTFLLLVTFIAIIFFERAESSTSLSEYLFLFPVTLLLNVISMVGGYYFSKAMGLKNRDNVTISIQVGLQNSALAIFVASSLLHNNSMSIVAIVYSSFSFFTTALYGYIMRRRE